MLECLLHCLCSHIWAAVDLAGRPRRQLRAQAALYRRAINRDWDQTDSEADTLDDERALRREEERWQEDLRRQWPPDCD